MKTQSPKQVYDSLIAEITDPELRNVEGSIHPEEFAEMLFKNLSDDGRQQLDALNKQSHINALLTRVRKQTKTRKPDRQGEFFVDEDLGTWIPASDGGRIKTKHAVRADLVAWREAQILNMRHVTEEFNVDEERRERMFAALGNDPNITIGDVWNQLSG